MHMLVYIHTYTCMNTDKFYILLCYLLSSPGMHACTCLYTFRITSHGMYVSCHACFKGCFKCFKDTYIHMHTHTVERDVPVTAAAPRASALLLFLQIPMRPFHQQQQQQHQYCHSHNNWGPKNSFQRFLVPVCYWKTVEKPETAPQLSWESQ